MSTTDYVSQALATGQVSQSQIDSFIANNPGDYSRIWSAFDLGGRTTSGSGAPLSSYSAEQQLRAMSGVGGAPFIPGISASVEGNATWMIGAGDMGTMSIDGEISGGGLAVPGEMSVGAPRVDESMQSRMAAPMLLPNGQHDYGKWIIIAGVLLALYLIGRETGRKGSAS